MAVLTYGEVAGITFTLLPQTRNTREEDMSKKNHEKWY